MDESFKITVDIFLEVDPFKIFNDDLKPRGYIPFLKNLLSHINDIYSNVYSMIEFFLVLNDIQAQHQETITKL